MRLVRPNLNADSYSHGTKERRGCCRGRGLVAGQTLGLLCPPKLNQKNMKTEFGENRKMALILSRQRGEHKADRSRTVLPAS